MFNDGALMFEVCQIKSWFSFNNPVLFCDLPRLMAHTITEGNRTTLLRSVVLR